MKEKLTKRICQLLEGTEHELFVLSEHDTPRDLDVMGEYITTDHILLALKIYNEKELNVIDIGQAIYVTSEGVLYAPGIKIKFELNKGLDQSLICLSWLCEMLDVKV